LLDDKAAEFDRLAERAAEGVRETEPDTLVYVIHVVPKAPMQRIIYEIYRDRSAFESHERQPHVQRFVADRRSCVLATNIIDLRLKYAKVAALGAPQSPQSSQETQVTRLPRALESGTAAGDHYAAATNGRSYASTDGQYSGSANRQYSASANGQYSGDGQYAASGTSQYPASGTGQYPGSANGQTSASGTGQYSGSANGQYSGSANGQYAALGTSRYPELGSGLQPESSSRYAESGGYSEGSDQFPESSQDRYPGPDGRPSRSQDADRSQPAYQGQRYGGR
jgi:quinol monooxygenase YgiN